MTDELLDIINEKNEVIGHATYDEVHEKKLPHRVVHGLVLNKSGDLLIQLRAANKSAYPLHWSMSVGGHVRHGETFEQALVREAEEEIGITVRPSEFIYKGEGKYIDEKGHSVFYKAYEIVYDGEVKSKTEEVDAVQFVSFKKLVEMSTTEKVQPEFLGILQKHWQDKLNG